MFRSFAALWVVVLLAACVSTTGVKWTDETVSKLRRGMSKSEVHTLFGSPTSQTKTAAGEVMIFKRPSDERRGVGTYLSVVTLGLRSGENSVYVDALRVELKNGVVSSYAYSENVDNNLGQAGLN